MPNKTVLLMSRGSRLHHLFYEMAEALSADHKVVVLASPEEVSSFKKIPSVQVYPYRTPDVADDKDVNVPRSVRLTRRSMVETLDDQFVTPVRVKAIEKEIGLTLYQAASNYLLYGRIVRDYGGVWDYMQTHEEIVQSYVGAYRTLSKIFADVHPSVVFYETLDNISSCVAFALARRHGVFGLEFRLSPLGQGQITPAFGFRRSNIVFEHLYRQQSLIASSSFGQADGVLDSLENHLERSAYRRMHKNMVYGSSPFNFRQVLPRVQRWADVQRGLHNLRWHVQSARNRFWLERHLTQVVPDAPYVFFPMHHQPEASTCSQSPAWVYQDMIIEQLAIHAPGEFKVVVKEHPRSYGRRGEKFFGRLLKLPNVIVCHPLVDNTSLIKKAAAVMVINGSIGLEAILAGARVGVLGRPYYSCYRGAVVLKRPEEIYEALCDEAWCPETMLEERRSFLAAYTQSLYEFGHSVDDKVFPESGGQHWAHALRSTMKFIADHKLKPADFESGW